MIRYSILIIALGFVFFEARAQQNILPCVIGMEGIIINKRSVEPRGSNAFTVNSITDTITLEKAKTLFALYLLDIKDRNIEAISPSDFTLTIIKSNEDTTRFVAVGGKFTSDMMDALQKLKVNSTLFFEDIRFTSPDNPAHKSRASYMQLFLK
jgi:hypothetical protein